MMAVAGAAIVLLTLAGASVGRRRSLAALLHTKTMRIGEQLALVGPIFANSTAWRRSSSETGRSSHALCVLALRKIWSSTRSSRLLRWPVDSEDIFTYL